VSEPWIAQQYQDKPCPCGSGLQRDALVDYQGIFCAWVCDRCREKTMRRYRPEIFTGYTQADIGEPIEPEES
jgi:hypothetical protein